MPDKLAGSEIVKALRSWLEEIRKARQEYLEKVNEEHYPSMRYEYLLSDTINEINRLQAKAEGLELELADTKRDLRIVLDNSISAKLPHCVLCGKGAILTKSLEDYDELIGDISNEARKEFAERLKKALYSDSCRLVFESDLNIFECAIDNLLKELVGDSNETVL